MLLYITAMKNPIYTAVSESSAITIHEYPYGGSRTDIRYWLESDEKKGYRFVSQTLNPKTQKWNNPKKSTYVKLAAAMFLNTDNSHIEWTGLSEYSSAEDIEKFLTEFPDFKPGIALRYIVAGRKLMAERTARGESNFKVNGVAQIPADHQVEDAKKEVLVWENIKSMLVSRSE